MKQELITSQREFDYGGADIAKADAQFLESRAKAIEKHADTAKRLWWDIAEELQKAHERLAHRGNGTFGKWCDQRLGISPSKASQLMRGLSWIEVLNLNKELFDQTASVYLSGDVDEETQGRCANLSQDGIHVTQAVAKGIEKLHRNGATDSEVDEFIEAYKETGKVPKLDHLTMSHKRAALFDLAEMQSTIHAELDGWYSTWPEDMKEDFIRYIKHVLKRYENDTENP